MGIAKYIKLAGLLIAVAAANIVVLSPGFIGLRLDGTPLSAALGVALLLASSLILAYGCYSLLFQPPIALPLKRIETHEDYAEALSHFRRVKALESDIALALDQLDRIRKRLGTLLTVVNQRFDAGELSHRKFSSVILEVEKLFYLNIRSLLNRLSVFDESEFERVMGRNSGRFPPKLLQEKRNVYNDYLSFVKSSLGANEEILLKLDKLLLEISRLDSFEFQDIEGMPCMQEIDSLIRQTKYYKP
ncbi:hypothetical protein [Cohnella boryungensis]|uniref:5-bromo-4-chloroindolyl phosphate hydrolysis protein n=1 Tax=Cohnella boryungensis TaxID=768479 RepID=A0ABV8S9U5_9BACL